MKKNKPLSKWKYYWKALTKYKIDSPFIYDFLENILEDDRDFYAFDEIEELRVDFLSDDRSFKTTSYNIDSQRFETTEQRFDDLTLDEITYHQGELLFKIINHYQPKYLIEIGTSLSFSTLYQAAPAETSTFKTFEICPNKAAVAEQLIPAFGFEKVQVVEGVVEENLAIILKKENPKVDYIFFNDFHGKELTQAYLDLLLPYTHNDTIMIVKNIHKTLEQETQWQEWKKLDKVTIAIDLYDLGLLFFRKEQRQKVDYTLIDSLKKPWQFGFRR